jgi:hypothetical protein
MQLPDLTADVILACTSAISRRWLPAQLAKLLVSADSEIAGLSITWYAPSHLVSRSIAAYLVKAWDVRNSCKHNGAVLPLSSAPGGRGADGVDAMA